MAFGYCTVLRLPGFARSRASARGSRYFILLRRLHSLSGIVPVGAFLFEHILISNSTAISGPDAYARQVSFLANLPLVFFLELFGIWLPIAFHALYGFYIWYRGDGNTMRISLDRQLDVHRAALDRRHRLRLHRLAHVDDALYRSRSACVSQRFVRQGAGGSVATPLLFAFYVVGLIARFVALRLWHLAVRGEVGNCFRRKGAEAISGRVPGILLCADERGGTGQLVLVPRRVRSNRSEPGTAMQTSRAASRRTYGKPVE